MFEQGTPTRRFSETASGPEAGIPRAGVRGSRTVVAAVLVGFLLVPMRIWAQKYTPPPPPLTTAPCVATKKDPCPAPVPPPPATNDAFPFPGDAGVPASSSGVNDTSVKPTPGSASKSSAGGDSFPFPGESPGTASPGGKAGTKAASSGDQFPFPGEDSGSNSSSSSSSSSAAAAGGADADPAPGTHLKDAGSSGSTASSRRKLAKVEDLDEREAKDLEVSHFYLTTGDFLGAYNRAKDAIRLYPDDAEAHFALAAAAQKLKKNEEAVAEYKSYLKLEPDGDHVKVAHRALTEIH
jgi:hypothetical protein